jgi:hypothetical protein
MVPAAYENSAARTSRRPPRNQGITKHWVGKAGLTHSLVALFFAPTHGRKQKTRCPYLFASTQKITKQRDLLPNSDSVRTKIHRPCQSARRSTRESVAHDQDLAAGGQLAKLHRPAHSVIGDSLGPTAHKQQALNQLAHDGSPRFAFMTSSRKWTGKPANLFARFGKSLNAAQATTDLTGVLLRVGVSRACRAPASRG